MSPGDLRQRLLDLAEPDYQAFSSRLLPGVSGLLGVRLPHLRSLARELARGDWRGYLSGASSASFEEILLQGMVIGLARAELDERLDLVARFVPKIDNWSVCDSFCCGLKWARDHQARVGAFLEPYLSSAREFDVRFGAVMLLNHSVDPPDLDRTLQQLADIRHEGYYAQMAVAWAVSVCFAKDPARTAPYLKPGALDGAVLERALRKILESRQVDEATKRRLRLHGHL